MWNLRNNICFNHIAPSTVKSIVLTVIKLVDYWTGTLPEAEVQHKQEWLPSKEDMDQMPLQECHPPASG